MCANLLAGGKANGRQIRGRRGFIRTRRRSALWSENVACFSQPRLNLKIVKTNAVRLLDQQQIRYQLREYSVDPEDLSAESVATKIGLPAEQVFKTLVVRLDNGDICFAVLPGDVELDMKSFAKVAGARRAEVVPLKDVQPLTGYIRGGVTALAAKKDFPVVLDETALLFDIISISAGARGTQILLDPNDYIRITQARTGSISREKG